MKDKSLLKNMVITDEYLDYLGDYFQNSQLKYNGWNFESWCTEMVGVLMWRNEDTKFEWKVRM